MVGVGERKEELHALLGLLLELGVEGGHDALIADQLRLGLRHLCRRQAIHGKMRWETELQVGGVAHLGLAATAKGAK